MRAMFFGAAPLLLLFPLCAPAVAGYLPDLVSGGRIQAGGQDLQVEEYSVPTTADWDSDGRKDLIVGQYMWGNIWRFVNGGTDLNPVFAAGKKINSGGEPITTTFT